MASRIKSSSGDVEIESTGSGIKFLSSGTEIGSITSGGLLSATTIDATKLTGAIPSSSGATETYVNTAVANAQLSEMTFKGAYNASTNSPDLDTNSVATAVGDMYVVSVSGTFFTTAVEVGDTLIAEISSAAVEGDWVILNKNLDDASIKVAYENNADTNEFSDADQTKLDGIAISANNYSKPSSEPISYVTGLQTALDSKVGSMGGTMTSGIIPDTDDAYDIGSAEYKIRDLYVSENSLWVGDNHKITISGGKFKDRKRKKGKTPKKVFDALIGAGKPFATESDLKVKFKADIHAPAPSNTVDPDHADFQPLTHQWLHFATVNGMAGAITPENIFDNDDDFDDDEEEKANQSTTYTKTEVDTADALKANQSTTYTKTEVDTALNGKQASGSYLAPTGDGSQLTGIEGGETTIGTNSGTTYADGKLFVSDSGMAYWKLNDGTEGWYEVGKLLVGEEGDMSGSIACGFESTHIIKSDNTVWAVGANGSGQLGIGNTTAKNTFTSCLGVTAKQVVCGEAHTAIIRLDDTVWTAGGNYLGRLGRDSGATGNHHTFATTGITAKQVSCGQMHTLLIKTDDTVWACGKGAHGRLGLGGTTNYSDFQSTGMSASRVGAGGEFSALLKADGTVWATGEGLFLGLGTSGTLLTFTNTGLEAKKLAVGTEHTLIIKPDDTVWACGKGGQGQLGDGDSASQYSYVSSTGAKAKEIACGEAHSVLLKEDGTVWATGANGQGQLGDGTTTTRYTWVSANVSAASIAAHGYHTILAKTDNTVWSCGWGGSGQLGLGSTANKSDYTHITTNTSGGVAPRATAPRFTDPSTFD